MRRLIMAGVGFLWVAACLASVACADSPTEMLEKGIYNEETVGNLDEAISIYRQVVSEAKETAAVAAEAQYRLGQCLLKQGKKDEATTAFQDLVKDFPEQKELVAKAKKHLPAAVELLPAPWEDGERLTLTMRLAGGLPIGIVGLGVDADKESDREVWKMLARRFVSGGMNQGVSKVVVDRTSNRPLLTSWDHTLLGRARGVWDPDKIEITMQSRPDQPETTKTVDLDGPAYANDQMFFGFRQLPLAIGYKVTIPLRVVFSGGNPVGLEVTVSKKEMITTPAGDFECFRLDTNIAQTFWIADVPRRYLVRFEAEGITADLTSIGKSAPTTVRNDDLAFSVTVPGSWFHYERSTTNKQTSAGVDMVAPEMAFASFEVENKSRLDPEKRVSPRAWAEAKIKSAKNVFQDVELSPNSMQDMELAGAPGVTFILDASISGRPFVMTAVLALNDEKAMELRTSTIQNEVEAYRPAFAAIRESVSVE